MAINSVNISGNVTRDPELRRTASGVAVLSFSVAVNNRRKNGQTGEWVDDPCFVDCVMFGNRADSLSNHISKGTKVCVLGKLRQNTWTTNDGQKRSKLDVVVDEVEFMNKNQNRSQGYQNDHVSQVRQDQAEYVEATIFDDDCPF